MSQYFLFVNLNKMEYIEPRGGLTLRDLCTDIANGILPYLLADGEKDGTPLMTSTSNEEVKNEKLKSGWKVVKEGEMLDGKYWIWIFSVHNVIFLSLFIQQALQTCDNVRRIPISLSSSHGILCVNILPQSRHSTSR